MNAKEITVAVTAVGSGIGQSAIQSLRDSDLRVRLIGFEVSAWAKGAYECDSVYLLPATADPSYRSELVRHCVSTGVHVLIPGSDNELGHIADLESQLRSIGCRAIVSSSDCVRICRNKLALHQYLTRSEAPFVATWSESEARSNASTMPYPLVLKPKTGSGSVGARMIPNEDAWKWLPSDGSSVVQPYLVPRDWDEEKMSRLKNNYQLIQEEELSVQLLLSPRGEIAGRFASINRLKEGIPVQVDPIDSEEVWQATQKIVRELVPLGLRGPCNLQGRWTNDGIKFFEINPRFTAVTGVRAQMGFNEVQDAIRMFCFDEPPDAVVRSRKSLKDCVSVGQMAYLLVPRRRFKRLLRNRALDARLPFSRAVVTGTSGHLGNALARALLSQGLVREIVAPVRNPAAAKAQWADDPLQSRLRWFHWNLDEPLCELDDCEVIIHCAAVRPLQNAAASSFEPNVTSMMHLTDVARRQRVPWFVFASSQAVYGSNSFATEEDELAPATCYAYSKVAGEALSRTLTGSPTRWAIFRFSRLYGFARNLNWNTWPPVFVDRVIKGLDLEIYGNPEQQVELLHTRDGVRFIQGLLHQPSSKWNAIYNVGTGKSVTILEVAKTCVSLGRDMGYSNSAIVYRSTEDFGGTIAVMNISKAKELEWEPKTDLSDGLRELMEFRISELRSSRRTIDVR